MAFVTPTDQEKREVWEAYRAGKPTRTPVQLATNPRVFLLDPQWNTEGWTFEQAAHDPETMVRAHLRYQLQRRTFFNHYTDDPTSLPDVWPVALSAYNVYEAAIFGAEIDYSPDQVPDTIPPFADEDRKEEIFELDIEHPLERGFCKRYLDFWDEMEKVCEGLEFEGRPVELQPWALTGTDGPVTVGCNLRGADFLMDLAGDPDYADRLMAFVVRAANIRRRAFEEYWGDKIGRGNGLADDSIAMLSVEMYREQVMAHHRAFYEDVERDRTRAIHLCGDAQRFFPIFRHEFGAKTFDTGFPVDHGKLREQLGPEAEIGGGPEVALLLNGTSNDVHERTGDILESGIRAGGRFILKEANNLPPRCPAENLQAMYEACLDHGRF